MHICTAHQGGPVTGEAKDVEINGQRAARGTDRAACMGPMDFIVTGSATVKFNSKPAARLTSKTAHGGMVVLGSGNVFIGGPEAGTTLGNPAAGCASCQAAASGRHPPPGTVYPEGDAAAGLPIPGGMTSQSYHNCGIEAARIIINQANGANYSEDEMLDRAIDGGNARGSKDPSKRYDAGGSRPGQREDLLHQHGVESTLEPQDPDQLAQAVAEGKGVITTHWAGELGNDTTRMGATHAVVATGATYDENGKLVSMTIIDTGDGNCEKVVPIDRYKRSLLPFGRANVTRNAIWSRP
jgi:uncharacterized Zn-binding protein involved in type VI secretion